MHTYSTVRFCFTKICFLIPAGDLARWLPNGHIDFLGRIDNQV